MSSYLWKAYYEDDVDTFRQLLETAVYNPRPHAARGGHTAGGGASAGSPNHSHHHAVSPTLTNRTRRPAALVNTPGSVGFALTRADINWRDGFGLTLLHHAASSISEKALTFATALIEHPLIDLYLQDLENGWTALHRAFYFGNITIARLILERDTDDALGKTTGHVHQTLGLVKIKDREGLGPLDLYAATIKDRTLRPVGSTRQRSNSNGSDEDRDDGNGDTASAASRIPCIDINGDQLFSFGSNKNVSLGVGDGDDRQFPERIHLRRPEHLLRRFYREHLEQHEKKWASHDPLYQSKTSMVSGMWVEDIPWNIRSRPISIQDVQMSKLHTALITSDPESNLYMCGHGQGGRLGTGNERTYFHFVCIEGGALSGKRVATVALGLNHTLALSDEGEIFSWGNNGFGQLGYSLSKAPSSDEDPISTFPRQIFGPLKRETVIGVSASRIHSVAHTSTCLFTFGKNDGQLGIVDSDARSLEMQVTPRKVAASLFSSSISSVTAIDKATICLLENHDVWVFANYGYAKVQFPLEGFTNYFLRQSFLATMYDHAPHKITKVTSGGDTICALSNRGEIYTFSIIQRLDNQASASTTNPAKIRNAITQAQRIWSPKKTNMAARDVGVDIDGSIILSTEEGSVWKRTRRAKIKDASAIASADYKPKDYKFSRIPALTRVVAVRSSGHGAYTAVRYDCDVLKSQIVVEDANLWKDFVPLLSLKHLVDNQASGEYDETRLRYWQGSPKTDQVAQLKRAILSATDIEADLAELAEQSFSEPENRFDALLTTTTSDVAIPAHKFMLSGRSRVLRRGFRDLCETSTFTIPDLAVSEIDEQSRVVVKFLGIDILAIIDLVFYLYTDSLIDFWHFTKNSPNMAYRYRQVRTDLMKIATKLELSKLEPAARQMVQPRSCLDMDFEVAFRDPAFFYDGDIVVLLEDDQVRAHSAVLCTRCPFFEGLFMGRAGGRWLADRGDDEEITVDLKHFSSKTFNFVLRHIYADTGAEMFDEIVSTDVDDFFDTAMDIMGAANELMLDRLSQTAQTVVGLFVNARNVCGLLNAISPSSVREFKDAGLEYLCLNLEPLLQGHFLNELDEDLLRELDDVVRENQLACMPFAKSGRAEMLLHERYADLAAAIDRNRRSKIDSVMLRSKFHDMETFKPGSLGDDLSPSPMQSKTRRRSFNNSKIDPDQPTLKAKASSKEMMFEMDEEFGLKSHSARGSPAIRPMSTPQTYEAEASAEETWYNSRGKAMPSPKSGTPSMMPDAVTPRTPKSPLIGGKTPPSSGKPWALTPLPTRKSDMRDIMAQTASSRTSSLSQGLASAQATSPTQLAAFSLPAPKMSQKDRKRLQQIHQQAKTEELPATPPQAEPSQPFSWQAVSGQKRPSLKGIVESEKSVTISKDTPSRSTSTPQLTMRQTIANPKPPGPQQTVTGPGAQVGIQQRNASDGKPSTLEVTESAGSQAIPSPVISPSNRSASKPIPQSIRHQPTPAEQAEQAWGRSMLEIVAQQQAEKDVIKEAAAKRDLQEIQAEQEFQEWWDKESARVQEAERRSAAAASKPSSKKPKVRGGKSSRGGKNRVDLSNNNASNTAQ